MLAWAAHHEEALHTAEKTIDLTSPKYRYYSSSANVPFFHEIDKTMWSKLQMVSLSSEGRVLGFFQASIDRVPHTVDGIAIISFAEANLQFAKDAYAFFTRLATYNFKVIRWSVVVGAPSEVLYDRVIQRFGGRVVGTFTKYSALHDGTLVDLKWYEIINE